MRIENLVIGVFLLFIASFSLAAFYGNTLVDYESSFAPTNQLANASFNFSGAATQAAGMRANASGTLDSGLQKEITKIPEFITGTILSGLQISTTFLRALFESKAVIDSVMTTLFSNPYFSVPDEVVAAIIGIVGLMFIFAISAAILKWRT